MLKPVMQVTFLSIWVIIAYLNVSTGFSQKWTIWLPFRYFSQNCFWDDSLQLKPHFFRYMLGNQWYISWIWGFEWKIALLNMFALFSLKLTLWLFSASSVRNSSKTSVSGKESLAVTYMHGDLCLKVTFLSFWLNKAFLNMFPLVSDWNEQFDFLLVVSVRIGSKTSLCGLNLTVLDVCKETYVTFHEFVALSGK